MAKKSSKTKRCFRMERKLKKGGDRKMESIKELTAGSNIDAWDTNYLPPEEWAHEIFTDAEKNAVMLKYVNRYDSPRKITIPVRQIQASEWTSTVGANVFTASSSASTQYDATGIALDPVEYRTYMPIARKSIEEATWSVEADVRKRLAQRAALKLDTEIWTCLDSNGLSSGKYQAGGESLDKTNTSNAVDYGTALTVENIVDAIYNIRSTAYNAPEYIPDVCVITPGMMKGLMKESTVISAAEYGGRAPLSSGVLSEMLGLDFVISSNVPQDSGSTDIGLVFASPVYFVGNVPHEFEIASELRRETDEVCFFVKVKCAFAVGDKDGGAVLYT